MHLTAFGMVLIPLSLLYAANPVRLLQLTLVSAVFEAAAAVAIGGFGLQPAMVPGSLFIGYVVLQYALGMRYPGEAAAVKALSPLLLLLAYAVLSAWLLPRVFENQIPVFPQKPDALADGMESLKPTFGNVTQCLYLTFDVAFALTTAIFCTRGSFPYRKIISAYLLTGYIVAFLVFWEFMSRVAGVPYPADFLHSNPGFAIVHQSTGVVPRMQGPFSEPSALAGAMCGMTFCALWLTVRGYRTMNPSLLFVLSLTSVLISTSTTGMLTLAVGLPLTVLLASTGRKRGGFARIGKTCGILVLIALMAVVPAIILKPSLIGSINEVVTSTLNKGDSDSYKERSEADAGGVSAAIMSGGLGVGWGSYRSSSLIPGTLANAGVIGLLLIVWQLLRFVRLGSRARCASPDHGGRVLVDGFSASLAAGFATALIAAPTISGVSFYAQFGALIGVLVRMTLKTRPRAVWMVPRPIHPSVRFGPAPTGPTRLPAHRVPVPRAAHTPASPRA